MGIIKVILFIHMYVSPVINTTIMYKHLLFPVASVMYCVVTIRPEGILFVPQKYRPDKNRCKFIITSLCSCHVPSNCVTVLPTVSYIMLHVVLQSELRLLH